MMSSVTNIINLSLLTLCASTTAPGIAKTNLEDVKKTLERRSDATWTAKKHSIANHLRPQAVKAVGGSLYEQAGEQDSFFEVFRDEETANLLALPHSFDWRNIEGANFMSPVSAQGECGSCVAMASVAALESTLNIACGTPGRKFNLSEQYVFSCGGGRCGGGWRVSQAVTFLSDHGAPDHGCLPYGAANGQDVSCDMACTDADDRLVQGVSWSRPTTGFININAIKEGLLKGPLLANMILFEDLEFYDQGVYRHVEGDQIGGHAVVLIGWDNADSSWIVRNSWGPEWGDNGYFKVAWDDVSLPGRYTWLFDVNSPVAEGVCSLPR